MPQRTHSARDVAAAFGVAPVTVRLWASQGRLPHSRTLGGHRRFDLDEVRLAANLVPIHSGSDSRHPSPDGRYSAAATAERIRDRLHNPEHEKRGNRFRQDAALRAVIDLRDALRRADPDTFSRIVLTPPTPVGDSRWDAFIAGVVEDEGARKRSPVPRWTGEPWRFTRPFWYVSPVKEVHSRDLEHTHGALLRHGVVVAHEDLESV